MRYLSKFNGQRWFLGPKQLIKIEPIQAGLVMGRLREIVFANDQWTNVLSSIEITGDNITL